MNELLKKINKIVRLILVLNHSTTRTLQILVKDVVTKEYHDARTGVYSMAFTEKDNSVSKFNIFGSRRLENEFKISEINFYNSRNNELKSFIFNDELYSMELEKIINRILFILEQEINPAQALGTKST